ncbi:hypothetical protein A2996_03555 [Candidatus Campbellbacteria bacterium RIFCSPLOWO2_01_FULL_34_15]|uniref:Transcriptional repressor PaaX-like central Cas2-like domain-containing protein n=2 Tax=Candidatus Campbelliibacteriota TaxID=1752727 RepID=A0A1F5EQ54_9BACT|nr:MAG: hypothetical protein A2811_02165 [Candidatus Campbellbacteria bacterium RIFCSPHIGHO2_01_FULL_34_10]OGD69513.1 MAG: hypothetical protein A2996_03555 [Candidatus Campbellbacteria bacterium RIFCSPLOWO2_01_FULL_34_15]
MNKKDKKVNLKKIILTTIATAGLLSVVILAPNALQVLEQFSGKKKYHRKKRLNGAIENLLRKDLIEFETKNGKKFVRLTKKGSDQLVKYQLGDLEIKKPKKWDKKWRMIIFDIKESRRTTRDILRNTLNRLGFVKLQNSVWVFPYDCEELIIMLKSDLFVGKDVLYIIADKIENNKWLRDSFGL